MDVEAGDGGKNGKPGCQHKGKCIGSALDSNSMNANIGTVTVTTTSNKWLIHTQH